MTNICIYPCLFCGDTTRKKTSEHVLQDGFGSNWTLPSDVCTECNTTIFSPLDKYLIEFAEMYIYYYHPDVKRQKTILQEGHQVWYDEKSEMWLSVRMSKFGKPYTFPQIIYISENEYRVSLNVHSKLTPEEQIEQIKEELKNPNGLSIEKRLFTQNLTPPLQPAIIRSKANKYLIRAVTKEEVDRIESVILTNQLFDGSENQSTAQYREDSNIKIQANIPIDIYPINRALAKTAVNVACACLGSVRSRKRCLREIKDFVLKQNSEDRYVELIWRANEEDLKAFDHVIRRDHHTVILQHNSIDNKDEVFIILYQRPFAKITLVEGQSLLHSDELFVALLNYKQKTHTLYSRLAEPSIFKQEFSL